MESKPYPEGRMQIDRHLLDSISELGPYSKNVFDVLPKEARQFCLDYKIPEQLVECLTQYNLASVLRSLSGRQWS